jgi:hypothetical protein
MVEKLGSTNNESEVISCLSYNVESFPQVIFPRVSPVFPLTIYQIHFAYRARWFQLMTYPLVSRLVEAFLMTTCPKVRGLDHELGPVS